MAGLDDILNPPEETEETGQEAVEETQAETPGAEETQVAAEPKEETPPATDTAEQVRAELAALTKERQRLREKEAAWEQERQQFLAQRQPKEEEKASDFWENPEGVIDQKTAAVQKQLEDTKINMSEALFGEMKPDYAEKRAVFLELVKHDPSLVQRMRADNNPAGFAYKVATEHLKYQELQQIGDPAAYKEKIEQELREKLRAEVVQEYAAKQEAEKKAAIEAKLSRGGFASERSVATSSAAKKSYNGPTPLDSILK